MVLILVGGFMFGGWKIPTQLAIQPVGVVEEEKPPVELLWGDATTGTLAFQAIQQGADTRTQLATNYTVLKGGFTSTVVAAGGGPSLTNAAARTTYTSAAKGQAYTVVVFDDNGAGSDYYLTYRTVSMDVPDKDLGDIGAYREGSLTYKETESDGTANNGILIVGAGETNSELTLTIKENTADAYVNKPAVCFNWTGNVTSVDLKVGGADAVDLVIPKRISKLYDACFDTGAEGLLDFASVDTNPIIKANSGCVPQDTIYYAVIDKCHFINKAGAYQEGYETDADVPVDCGIADSVGSLTINPVG